MNMNRPYVAEAPSWGPKLRPRLIQLLSGRRRRRALDEQRLRGIEVRGAEALQAAIAADHGVLIAPNHASHADPYVLLDVADQVGQPFYFMVAWHVFADQGPLGRFVLRSHGSFSVNREATDWAAVKQAAEILKSSRSPLVIFPEGDIFHVNDRVRPFHGGCGTIAQFAARRADRKVVCFPCGIQYRYVEDPTPELLVLADRLERLTCRRTRPDLSLAERARRLMLGLLRQKEQEYFGYRLHGSAAARMDRLSEVILGNLEQQHGLRDRPQPVNVRVQWLRLQIVHRMHRTRSAREELQRQLADLNFVVQLFSYPADYLEGDPPIERVAETWDRLEEDVLGNTTARARGFRRATVTFGEPIAAEPERSPSRAAQELTHRLEYRVRQIVEPGNFAVERRQLSRPRPSCVPAGAGAAS